MTFSIALAGSCDAVVGLRLEVLCHLHEWDLIDQVFPDYIGVQTEDEDFEEEGFTVNVLTISATTRALKEITEIAAAMVKLWGYLSGHSDCFQCAENDDLTAVPMAGYDDVKATAVGKEFCDRLSTMHEDLCNDDEWYSGSSKPTEFVVARIEAFCQGR